MDRDFVEEAIAMFVWFIVFPFALVYGFHFFRDHFLRRD